MENTYLILWVFCDNIQEFFEFVVPTATHIKIATEWKLPER